MNTIFDLSVLGLDVHDVQMFPLFWSYEMHYIRKKLQRSI